MTDQGQKEKMREHVRQALLSILDQAIEGNPASIAAAKDAAEMLLAHWIESGA